MKKNLYSGHLTLFWMCVALLAMCLSAAAQTLQHRYSFFAATNGTPAAIDLVGTNNGTLFGDAQITGGQLQLDGSAYVGLQPGIITNDLAVTVEAWGDFPVLSSQGNWANLFDFGTQDTNVNDSYSISFCVNTVSPAASLDAAISDFDNANTDRQNCYADANLLAGSTGGYVAAVFNPPAGFIGVYVNGSLVGSLTGVTNMITPGVRDLNNWIGKDNWPDPDMAGNLDEFRVWNGALDSLKIAASYQNGFSVINTNAGSITSIQFTAGPQVVQGGEEPSTVMATASLITNTVEIAGGVTYTSGNTNILTVDSSGFIHGVALGSNVVTAFYGGQSNSTTVTVIEPVSILAHRYSFNDAPGSTTVADSVGKRAGQLMGTAYVTNGQVVLDGTSGCYVDLSSNGVSDDGLISGYQSATVDYWATFGALGNWNYAWVCGNTVNGSGQNYIHSVARDGNTQHEIDNYTTKGGSGFAALGPFANESVHCTTLIDVPTGHLAIYTNGVLSGYVTNDFAPLSSIATNEAYIGHSLWTADPYLPGSFDEFRVYNGTLTPQQIALADALGPDNTNLVVGNLKSISVSIPKLNLGDAFLGGVLVNYSNLTNFNLLWNTMSPVLIYTSSNSNVVYQAADGKLHATGPGTAMVTAKYNGLVASQAVTVVYAPVLVNRYSFQDAVGTNIVADSVGGWNGTLPNGGTFTGTNLQLLASGEQYVQLPSGILSNYPAVTIDVWATFPDALPGACFLYGFGNTDTNANVGESYIFCQPQNGRIAICGVDPGYDGEEGCTGAGNFSLQTNLHVTSVYDPPAGLEQLYTNGVLVSQNTGITVPMSYVQSVLNYLGHSLYPADSYMDVDFNEFRIYNGALSADDIAISQLLGPSVLLSTGSAPKIGASVSAGSVVISWPAANAAGFSLYSSPTLGPGAVWALVAVTPSVAGQNLQVSIPTTGAAQFYLLKK
ncbi:MAG: LamG-like jellyroll fold domain-containing protein [Verrucomicrobiota bacterium]